MEQQSSTPRVLQWPYKYKGTNVDLNFDPVTGESFLPRVGWVSADVLRSLGYIQQSITKPLPTPKPLPFGDPNKYEGRWRTTRPRGSKEGTGKFI